MLKNRLIACCAASFAALVLALSAGLPAFSADAAVEGQQRLLRDIKFLTDDELEGRGVGLKGLDLAADYIRAEFAKAGLKVDASKGGPFQSFEMHVGADLGAVNTLEFTGPDGKKFELKIDADFVPQSFGDSGAFHGELAFCGYGIEAIDREHEDLAKLDAGEKQPLLTKLIEQRNYDDFAGLDVKGKVVIVMRRVPDQSNPRGRFAGRHGAISSHAELRTKVINAFEKGAGAVLIVNDPHSGRQEREQARKQAAKAAEAVADAAAEVEAIDPRDAEKLAAARKKLSEELVRYKAEKANLSGEEPDTLMKFGYAGSEAYRGIPVLHITRAAADQALKGALGKSLNDLEAAIDKEVKPQSAILTGWSAGGVVSITRRKAEVKNVVGVLEGSGPLADETLIIGAHYDHVGRGGPGSGSALPASTEIHNGADDNGSGTAALLELARRLAGRAEKLPRRIVFIAFTGEERGLFGSARYTSEPIFPLDKTIAMLNLDMVGRMKDEKLTVYGTGTSPIWNDQLTELGKQFGLTLNFQPEGFGPSDHSSFYAKQIPVLHFFSGFHSDYHRPSDDWEKINVPGAETIVQLIDKLAVRLAQTPERPRYVEVKGNSQIGTRDGARPYFGSIPDFGGEKKGYALSGVAPGSPADKGGLQGGDRIVQLGTVKVESLEDFDLALRRFSPGEEVEVTVMRGEAKVVLKVTLGKPRG